jgi:hypothetical protein
LGVGPNPRTNLLPSSLAVMSFIICVFPLTWLQFAIVGLRPSIQNVLWPMFSMVELGAEHPNTKGSFIGGGWGMFMKLSSISQDTLWWETK